LAADALLCAQSNEFNGTELRSTAPSSGN